MTRHTHLIPVLTLLGTMTSCLDEGVYVIPETQAATLVREALADRGIDAAPTTRQIDGVSVCVDDLPCHTLSLALDGWDEVHEVGFAYLTEADRGGPSSMSIEIAEAAAIQSWLDTHEGDVGLVVVFREWAHETESLAVDQFRRAVEAALDTRGLLVEAP